MLGAFPFIAIASGSEQKVVEQSASAEAEKWMDESLQKERSAHGGLYFGRFSDPIYFLTKSITWKPNKGQEHYKEVNVPVGFVTDLASIPRIFWSALRPDGSYAYAAIVHDYLYWVQGRSREESDTILKFGMQDFPISSATIAAIYLAVRAGGGASWSQNAKLRRTGERRILKRFPDDPTISWSDWKKRPDTLA